jgi:hypothetical protein
MASETRFNIPEMIVSYLGYDDEKYDNDAPIEYSMVDNDYDTIDWSDNNSDPLPTLQQLTDHYYLWNLRQQRNARLTATDHYALSDVTMSAEMEAYRQALRDITDTYSSIEDEGFSWPTKP